MRTVRGRIARRAPDALLAAIEQVRRGSGSRGRRGGRFGRGRRRRLLRGLGFRGPRTAGLWLSGLPRRFGLARGARRRRGRDDGGGCDDRGRCLAGAGGVTSTAGAAVAPAVSPPFIAPVANTAAAPPARMTAAAPTTKSVRLLRPLDAVVPKVETVSAELSPVMTRLPVEPEPVMTRLPVGATPAGRTLSGNPAALMTPHTRSIDIRARGGASSSSASANSPSVRKRLSRSFSRHLSTTASSNPESSGRFVRSGGGGSTAIFTLMSGSVCPRNGASPVRSSYKMTPSDQMSVRRSTPRVARICSGDM
jgi:hypothetical protein